MSSFNDNLKNISIKNLIIFIIVSYIVLYILGQYNHFFNQKWIYVLVIFYFVFQLRDYSKDFKSDFFSIFSKIGLKQILLIVFANIFFSYGMLYVANYLLISFPDLDFLVSFSIPSMSLVSFAPLISIIIVSPIAEELLFRGVLLNKLKMHTPTIFAVLISALIFGSLHTFGSVISAVVFGICMAILYLKTENICVPILAHFLNNLFAEIIKFMDVNNILFTNNLVMSIMGIFAIVSAIILLCSMIRELNTIK